MSMESLTPTIPYGGPPLTIKANGMKQMCFSVDVNPSTNSITVGIKCNGGKL